MNKIAVKWCFGSSKGFTLIELLVVVLIIGILAAVALPQYQKAVLKSRFAALKPLAKTIKNAQEIYFNEHGEYATQLSALDIQAPAEAEVELSDTDGHEFVRATKTGLENRYTMYLDHSTNFAGNTYCEAPVHDGTDATLADEVCLSDGGQDVSLTNDGYKLYLLSGSSAGEFAVAGSTEPKNIFASFFEGLGSCSGDCDTEWEDIMTSLGGTEVSCSIASGGEVVSGDSECFQVGDWIYRLASGSSAHLAAGLREGDGIIKLNMEYRTFEEYATEPQVTCSYNGHGSTGCTDICGDRTSCTVDMN